MIHALVLAAALCANPNQEGAVVNQVQPIYPAGIAIKAPVTVLVRVKIGSDGNLEEAAVFQSSGDPEIDAAALRAAQQSTYSPALANCAPVERTYISRFDLGNFGGPALFASFQKPSGWNGPSMASSQSARYARGTEEIVLGDIPTHKTTDQIREELSQSTEAGQVKVTSTTACGGVPAYLLSETHDVPGEGSVRYVLLFFFVYNHIQYTAGYSSRGSVPPGPDIETALRTFCPPDLKSAK